MELPFRRQQCGWISDSCLLSWLANQPVWYVKADRRLHAKLVVFPTTGLFRAPVEMYILFHLSIYTVIDVRAYYL